MKSLASIRAFHHACNFQDHRQSVTEWGPGDGDYHYDGGELHALDRLKRSLANS